MLGDLLRAARESAGLTQEALAFKAEVDRSYISQLERNLKSPTIEMFFRLCVAMDTSPSELIGQLESVLIKKRH